MVELERLVTQMVATHTPLCETWCDIERYNSWNKSKQIRIVYGGKISTSMLLNMQADATAG